MLSLGYRLTLLIGPTLPAPASPELTQALDKVEVTHNDKGRSGFQITFQAGRSGPSDLMDYALYRNPLLQAFNRVVLVVILNAIPQVLMDGIITNQQLSPGSEPGSGTLTVTGEDVSMMMDREEKPVEHPAQDESVIAAKLIASYAQYGLIPMVTPPPTSDPPLPTDRTPVQQATDLQFLKQLAERHGYVFYVKPGPAPMTNSAYWGPPVRAGLPQRALTVNMGPASNVNSIKFQYNSLSTAKVKGKVQDRDTNQQMPVETFGSLRPPLAAMPDWLVNEKNAQVKQFKASGLNATQAFSRAQGAVESSTDQVLTASGELDAIRYGECLWARQLVGLRGVGQLHDGHYYVNSVTHSIRRGEYKQQFSLSREGLGSLTPTVQV